MGLPPSVKSIIKRHIKPTNFKRVTKTNAKSTTPGFQALAPTLNPATSNPTLTSVKRNAPLSLSVKGALTRYPRVPTIAMAAAHRLLEEQAAEASTSSQVTHLLRRQRVYERLIRIFVSHPTSEGVTVPSLFQRMMDERVPPNLDTLKIVLGTAGRHGTPILPILRNVLDLDGLPEKSDTHLLGLVMKALVREGGMTPKDLETMLEECTTAGVLAEEEGRPILFDEILVEAYGQYGDLRGILDVLSRHRPGTNTIDKQPESSTFGRGERGVLSLYLQAIRQWISNPSIRRKRRGSLFPRILAKDLVEIYGGSDKLPLIWLNTWMNAERIAHDTEAGMTVWKLIGSEADFVSYATYFQLSKLVPTHATRLRATVSDLVAYQHKMESASIETIESALTAAFHHHDLPLALFLARQIVAKNTRASVQLRPTERTIDVIAAGLVRAWRRGGLDETMRQISTTPAGTVTSAKSESEVMPRRDRPEYIVRDEWDMISIRLNDPELALPLSRPLARLITPHSSNPNLGGRRNDRDEVTVMTFTPPPGGAGSKSRSAKLGRALDRLVGVLEEAIVERSSQIGVSGKEILARTMQELHREVLPPLDA